MTAALLHSPQALARRAELRRCQARQEFFSPLEIGGPAPLNQTPLLPKPEEPAESVEMSPPPEPLPPPEPSPRDSVDAGPGTSDSVADDPAADARKMLADARVRLKLLGKSPSRRNREVYRAVVIEERKQQEVAVEFGISQPRVVAILKQVGNWLSRTIVERDQARSSPEQLQLAENVVRMQYDHLYALALEQSRIAQQETVTVHEERDPSGELLKTRIARRPNPPKAGFVNAARQAVTDRAKFEGLIGLPARRAEGQSQPPVPKKERSLWVRTEVRGTPDSTCYKPLSAARASEVIKEEDEAPAGDATPDYAAEYAACGERFAGPFADRAAYYETQVIPVFGVDPDETDPEETDQERAESVQWMHNIDLLAAKADAEAAAITRRTPSANWTDEQRQALREQLLIERVCAWEEMSEVDAADLLQSIEYDTSSGRFGWDLRFAAGLCRVS